MEVISAGHIRFMERKRCILGLGGGIWKEYHLEVLDVKGRMILKYILYKLIGRLWARFILFWMETNDGIL
jgi:hypothetical protein